MKPPDLQYTKPPSLQATKPSSNQAFKLSSHQNTKSSSHRTFKPSTTKPLSHRTIKPPNPQATKPLSHRTIKPPIHQANEPPSHRTIKPPSQQATKPPSHQAFKPPSHRATKPSAREPRGIRQRARSGRTGRRIISPRSSEAVRVCPAERQNIDTRDESLTRQHTGDSKQTGGALPVFPEPNAPVITAGDQSSREPPFASLCIPTLHSRRQQRGTRGNSCAVDELAEASLFRRQKKTGHCGRHIISKAALSRSDRCNASRRTSLAQPLQESGRALGGSRVPG
ncbi:uncharacterized protein LOC134767436 [Penaeus indicus]|uniref:uncharacterized protein LOC134767436 n=1 Tax=Penaeus indicus TaxID=29960 RepID=UPI00300CE64A